MGRVTDTLDSAHSRRTLIKSALILAGGAAVGACTPRGVSTAVQTMSAAPPVPVPQSPLAAPVLAAPVKSAPVAPAGIRPELFKRAIAALDRHSMAIPSHDRIAIADFSMPSVQPRFYLINLGSGRMESLLVTHGSGSDPEHTGFLQRFSNDPGSNATCEGAFLTSDYYFGRHGTSQRLLGLDPTNSNALDRAIVVHGASYATPRHIAAWGKLGRSQGCFAVGPDELEKVFLSLGPGRMIYAAKI